MVNGHELSDGEAAVRDHLQRAAQQAPTSIPDLAATLLRRRSVIRRRRRSAALRAGVLVAGAAAVFGVVVAAHHSPQVDPNTQGGAAIAQRAPAHSTVDLLSCPPSISGFTTSRSHQPIGTSLVPGAPTSVHACGYTPDVAVAGRTKYESLLSGPDVESLLSGLNAMTASPVACLLDSSSPVLLRFEYATGDEVDVQLTAGSDCTKASNGVLTRWTAGPVHISLLGAAELSKQVSVASTTEPGSIAGSRPAEPSNPPAGSRKADTTTSRTAVATSSSSR